MEKLAEEIRILIEANFDGAHADITPVSGYKVGGTVLWNEFDGQRQSERQQRLWTLLRNHLNAQQQMGVATLLTFTPQEVEEMQQVLAA